jgi:2-polyprenyl-3-methyl-5-hydroxy-6-metoxy-1,4-benzoquinol methylase
MKALDLYLQRRRIAQARRYIPRGARVLDVGCGDGTLFTQLAGHVAGGIGVDPTLTDDVETPCFKLLRGRFPDVVPRGERFDAITMLAVLEHIPEAEHTALVQGCLDLLKDGGRVLITVPHQFVDKILELLMALRLIDGMAVEEHHGFEPENTPKIFGRGDLQLLAHRRFQLGLNNLFAFERRSA